VQTESHLLPPERGGVLEGDIRGSVSRRLGILHRERKEKFQKEKRLKKVGPGNVQPRTLTESGGN